MSSESYFDRSLQIVPGGVHSPVRSFKGLHTTPRFIEKGNGAKITDSEGNEYIDFCMSFGPLILGHRNPIVEEALHKALERGWSYGAAERYSLELAEFLVNRLGHVDMLRFVNSGTEAVMTAIRLARGATGKNKILKFNGCYHGHVDAMLIKAGSGLAGTADASSKGVPSGVSQDTLILELADLDEVRKCYEDHKDQIAAIIVEPLPANNGLIIQTQEFLQGLRDITKANNSLLIFDEVISGFRVSFGGMVEQTGIEPDIVTYGKIIGGGLPVGAIAGKRDVMENLAPIGGVYQAGTLSANPLAMVGGLETLKQLDNNFYNQLNKNSEEIVNLFKKFFAQSEYHDYQIQSYGSLFYVHPEVPELNRADQLPVNLGERFFKLFEDCLSKGIYLAPNAYEVGFNSIAHDNDIIAELGEKLKV